MPCDFNPSAFRRLKRAEENHFWFQVRRKWIFDRIKSFIPPPALLLEIGCGTGNVSRFLAEKGYSVIGCEYYRDAIELAWSGFQLIQGDAVNLPLKDNSFDIACLFDVIEHFQDDTAFLREAVRVVKRRGVIAVTVPAREELWSYIDDRSLHKRRYTKERLRKTFSEAGLLPLSVDYMFSSLYLPMKFLRQRDKKIDNQFQINMVINTLFKEILNIERIISKVASLPVGTSIIGIAQKRGI